MRNYITLDAQDDIEIPCPSIPVLQLDKTHIYFIDIPEHIRPLGHIQHFLIMRRHLLTGRVRRHQYDDDVLKVLDTVRKGIVKTRHYVWLILKIETLSALVIVSSSKEAITSDEYLINNPINYALEYRSPDDFN